MQRKLSPRDEYLLQEKQRVDDSATLQEKFPDLKTLTVDIAYLISENRIQRGQMKYTVNVAHAKSVFRLSCPNSECVEGDFDLSAELASVIRARLPAISGELVCQGWQSRTTIGQVPCRNILCYTLSLEYQEAAAPNEIASAKR
jgi:hypothetical protein